MLYFSLISQKHIRTNLFIFPLSELNQHLQLWGNLFRFSLFLHESDVIQVLKLDKNNLTKWIKCKYCHLLLIYFQKMTQYYLSVGGR